MSGLRRLRVTELHPNLLCILCGGYYVDATTIVECLHSFCKTCIVRYLESSKFCPICDVQVHKTKPLLSIRPDKILQDIVYKLVPGLYQNEMCRRREFYTNHPESGPTTAEDGGNDVGRWYILPDDPVSLALHPAPPPPTHRCLNALSSPTPHTFRCLKCHLHSKKEEQALQRYLRSNKSDGHVRYLQCPAGVSVAQLKRLLRAKFGVGHAHPMALLTSSQDLLNDAWTLVDVAYITSWQRTEPLQLMYRIYERASKKIKLDLDCYTSEAFSSSCEEMPKLEPSVSYDMSETLEGVGEYQCAPRLQAMDTLSDERTFKRELDETIGTRVLVTDSAVVTKSLYSPETVVTSQENYTLNEKPNGDVDLKEARNSPSLGNCDVLSEITQGTLRDSVAAKVQSALKGDNSNVIMVDNVGNALSVNKCEGTDANTENSVMVNRSDDIIMDGRPIVCIGPTRIPCIIVPGVGCIPVRGNCIPTEVPLVHRPSENVNSNSILEPKGEEAMKSEDACVSAENQMKSDDGEEEDQEVQLKISESGIMSVCGQDTTVEGMLNSEACELLSKIESGSLGDDFPSKAGVENSSMQNCNDNSDSKSTKSKEEEESGKIENERNEGEAKVNKENSALKVDRLKPVSQKEGTSMKPEQCKEKETNDLEIKQSDNTLDDKGCLLTANSNKNITESGKKLSERKLLNMSKPLEVQGTKEKEMKDGSSVKDSRSSHIPASLTAASMANLNKPHLKAGPSKFLHEEDIKKEIKPNNSSIISKKDAKLDSTAKSSSISGCRKSSQPYGYKTLKTPPKSWNPTISREHLALGANKSFSSKGGNDPPRTNKFFKNRNVPRFLGNPSAGVKPMYSRTGDNNTSQKHSVVLKLDPKTLGPVAVPVSSDVPTNVAPSVFTSAVSSGQSVPLGTVQSSSSLLCTTTFPTSACVQIPVCSTQPGVSAASVQAVVSKLEGTVPTSATNTLALPAVSTSGTKDSTNDSSKLIGNTNNLHSNKNTLNNNNKMDNNNKSGGKVSASKSNKSGTVQRSNNCKPEFTTGVSALKADKANGSAALTVGSNMASLVPNNHYTTQLKMSSSVTSCITKTETLSANSITGQSASLQPPQHLSMNPQNVGVGIIPSCGVSFAGGIGTIPLPYYTNPTLGYPAYPYLYQGTETISLIPPHPSASFIPTFSACIPPRPPLSPRNIGGAKMLPDLSLQPSLLPMVPLVPQVPPQASSPRPMTPPSPRTPTSAQSPKPYPAQSPRQSCTNQSSRPHTPQSPKTFSSTLVCTKSQAQSPKHTPQQLLGSTPPLKTNTSGISVPQTQWPSATVQQQQMAKLQTGVQQSLPGNALNPPSFLLASPSISQSSCPQLNVSLQTTVPHTSSAPKYQHNNVTSPKPHVPLSSKPLTTPIANTLSLTTHTPQSPKPSNIQTTQVPRPSGQVPYSAVQNVNCNNVVASATPLKPVTTQCSRYEGTTPWPHSEAKSSAINKEKANGNFEETSRKKEISSDQQKEFSCSSSSTPTAVVSASSSQVGSTLPTGNVALSVSTPSEKSLLLQGIPLSLPSPSSSLHHQADVGCPTSITSATMAFPQSSVTGTIPVSQSNVCSYLQNLTCNSITNVLSTCNMKLPSVSCSNTYGSSCTTSIAPSVPLPTNSTLCCSQQANNTIWVPPTTAFARSTPIQSTFVPYIPPVLSLSTVSAPLISTSCCIAPLTASSSNSLPLGHTLSALGTSQSVGNASHLSQSTSTSVLSTPSVLCNSTAASDLHPSLPSSTSVLPVSVCIASMPSPFSTPTLSSTLSTGMTPSCAPSPVMSTSQSAPFSTTTVSLNLALSNTLSSCTENLKSINVNRRASEDTPVTTTTLAESAPISTSTAVGSVSTNAAFIAKSSENKTSAATSTTLSMTITSPLPNNSAAATTVAVEGPLLMTNVESVPVSSGVVSAGSPNVKSLVPPCSTTCASVPVNSTPVVAQSRSSDSYSPCGTAGGKCVVNLKEQGGFKPQSSACTPVCDVTHVIDAKQPCAEPNVGSSGGPRPCLKS